MLEKLSPHAISGDGLFSVHERIRDVEEHGKSCLAENLEAIASINAEGRHNWKPMHVKSDAENEPFCGQQLRWKKLNARSF